MKEFGTVWCANIVIAAFATSLIPLPTAMAGNAMPSKLKDNIAHRTLAGDVLACERCDVTNVSGSIPDRKPIEPAMVSATRATDRPDFQSTTAIISSAAGTNVSSLTTTNWKQLPPLPRTAVTPLARNNTAAAYDEAHEVVVIFGGRHYQLVNGNWVPGDLGDTWIWNGQEWSEQHPINKPPPRSFTTMAYDPAVGKIVLFGGWCFSCGTYLNDTWEWDGNNWTQINTPTAPPPRIGASIGYDAAHNQFVLFGGQVVIGGVSRRVADTWIFDGVTWTQVFPASSPTARSGDVNLMT